jgi:hypothetical protein
MLLQFFILVLISTIDFSFMFNKVFTFQSSFQKNDKDIQINVENHTSSKHDSIYVVIVHVRI